MKYHVATLVFSMTCVTLSAPRQALSAPPPNVVIVLADDQGWGDLSISGNRDLATPNIDSLASSGASFDRFYVCPVCAPTRAEFLTGRYHLRGGVRGVSAGGERLNLDEKTVADSFKAAGYATGAFGKWHNGTQYPYHPNARGFDEYYGFTSGHWGHYFDAPMDHNGTPVQGKGYITDDLTDRAIQFMERNRKRPFFCYVPYNVPHSPMQVPDRFFDKFADLELTMHVERSGRENLAHTRAALAMCENLDWNVGRILQALDRLELADNTIVIYFSDNGPNGQRWNGGMKGIKGSTDEGGIRSPFFIRWPGRIPAGKRIPHIAGAIDLLPTLADLAGVRVADGKPLDGVSLKPLLAGDMSIEDWPARTIFSHWGGKVSARTQRYRMDNQGHLFDMLADPGQQQNINDELPEMAAALSKAIEEWKGELQVTKSRRDDRPYPVGYPQFPTTVLPARDGAAHGGVKRSSNAPNCSYFRNWTSTKDSITWDIEVATAGTYEAAIYYTCAQADIGSTVELSFRGQRIQGELREANDPPLVGAEQDRSPRKLESYVKDFKPWRIGTMKLSPGRGLLTLRAVDIPGQQVMDVRMVSLTLR